MVKFGVLLVWRYPLRRPKLLAFFIALVALISLAQGPAEAQRRETKTLVLNNGVEVLLMHDPEVTRSAAALAVGVGSLYDPEEKLGLAHYLEHMLFLGTKKYPEVNAFDKLLSANAGDNSAYTEDVVTNYFFEVSHGAFEEGLDRFSQFFKAPLFDKQYSEREVNAVHSEHDKNKLRDGWRIDHAMDQIAEEGHPVKKFGTGNKETLSGNNRPALLAFYRKYYAASRMKLAMLSNLSIRVQEELAEKYFSDIPDHPVEMPPIDPNYRKPLKGQYRLMQAKTISDIQNLTLTFPTIRLYDHLGSKPADIVAHILGYEGKGSLLSKLKEEGLALGLSAEGDFSHPNLSFFDISVRLTQKGEKDYEKVLELVFAYIHLLKEHGFEEYTFREAQAMAQIDFEWKDPDEGMGYVASKADQMHNYQLKDVETLPYLYQKYDPAAYTAVLDTLTPENMLAVLQFQSVETDRQAEFYGTEYSIREVGGHSFEKLRTPPKVEGIFYPKRNDFIPYNLTLIEEEPSLIRDDPLAKVWFQFDNRFEQPKVNMKLRIETPHVYDTVRNYACSRLYSAAVQEGLNELVYPIQLAGLSYGLSVRKKGAILTLGGYSQKISDLLQLVAKNLTRISIDEQKFNDLKRAVVRRTENRKLRPAYSRASYYNRLLWRIKQYDEEQIIDELKSVTFDDLKEHAKGLYDKVFITGVVNGNWTEVQVRESLDLLLAEIKSQPLPKEERYQEKIEVLDPGERILFSKKIPNNNNALYYSLQVGEMELSAHAKASLVASIVETDFYTQMRTNQQLGYIVSSFNHRSQDRLFFNFLIQSAGYGPVELKARVESWMKQSYHLFDELTDEEFERHRKGLIVSLEEEGDSIAEVTEELYNYVTREKGNFRYHEQLVDAAKKLTKAEVVAAARKIFLDSETPRTVVLIRSQGNNEQLPEGVLTTVSQIQEGKSKR